MKEQNNLWNFKLLMSVRFLMTVATQIQTVLLAWRMYSLTSDPLYLGFIGLAEAIPALGLALNAGHIVDRGRPLFIFRQVLKINFFSASVFLLSQLAVFSLNDKKQMIALFVSAFLSGVARAFSSPTLYAIVPRILLREEIPKASAWMSTTLQLARILGPALAGPLYALAGMDISVVIVCLLLFFSMVACYGLRLSLPALPARFQESNNSMITEVLSGAKFVFNHPILLPALSLDMISVLFGGVTALLPIYASDILLVGPTGLGFLRASPAVGAAIMSFWLTSSFDFRTKAGQWLISVVIGFGACILVFALSKNYLLSLFALTLSGAFDSVSVVIRSAAVQLSSPEEMRGRISAVNSIFIGSSNELGEFESGVAAKLFGTVPAAVFGGIFCLMTVFVVSVFSSNLRKLNLNELKSP